MKPPERTSTTTSPSDSPACRTCGVIAYPTCFTDEDGHSFCSVRCYAAWVENLTLYLEAAKAGRHYFEKPNRAGSNPTIFLTDKELDDVARQAKSQAGR